MNKTALDFWEECHKVTRRYISGINLKEVLDVLLLDKDIFTPEKTILNIGVGTYDGYYPELSETGCTICSLDISPYALKNVEEYGPCYLPKDLPKLPRNSIDIVLSRLVAQHMPNEDLLYQLKHVFECLKPTGFLAIQFAEHYEENENVPENIDVILVGEQCRSNRQILDIIKQTGGTVFVNKLVPTIPFNHPTIAWRIIHARKK